MARPGSIPRKIVLPEGALQRFRLPEGAEPARAAAPQRRTRVVVWVALWALFSWVCFQWSEGHFGPRSWLAPTLQWAREWQTAETFSAARRPPLPLAAAAAAVSAAPGERAAVVAAPKLALAPPPALSSHRDSFELPSEREEPLPRTAGAPKLDLGVELQSSGGDDSLSVHAGPGCERAKRRYRESFLEEDDDPASVALLSDAKKYAHCRADLMSLRICALVHRGEAVGVTVQSEPPNRVVSTCAAIVAKTLKYPYSKRPRLMRTELYFQ